MLGMFKDLQYFGIHARCTVLTISDLYLLLLRQNTLSLSPLPPLAHLVCHPIMLFMVILLPDHST